MNASDFKCSTCKTAQAEYFYPDWDLDQETEPKPYCKKCLKAATDRLIVALFELEEKIKKGHPSGTS